MILKLKNFDIKDFEILSFELIEKDSNELVAGEIGYRIKNTYTSLSGFSSKEKTHKNCGTLQMVLLALYLEKKAFVFWNLGHPYMDYKTALGAKVYPRMIFLERWLKAIN